VRLSLLYFCLGFLFSVTPVSGRASSSDSQTLQALLAEVRQLRQDLQTTSAATLRAQILVYRIQVQQSTFVLATQRLDSANAKLSAIQSEKKASGIRDKAA
jgi:hypothetical protein